MANVIINDTYLTNIANAVRSKNGSTTKYKPSELAPAISAIETGSGGSGGTTTGGMGGSYDREGLKAIGYTDDVIDLYNKVCPWTAEQNNYFKLTDEDKSYYGVINKSNLTNYKDKIYYLPFFDTSSMTNLSTALANWYSLVTIPQLDTSNFTTLASAFTACFSLVTIPKLDTTKVTKMGNMFKNDYSLVTIPQLNTINVNSMTRMFQGCMALTTIPQLNTSNVTDMSIMFDSCYALVLVPQLDASKVIYVNTIFNKCYALKNFGGLKDLGKAYLTTQAANYASYTLDLSTCYSLTYDSLMNVINNLYDIASKGVATQQLILAPKSVAKLNDNEKAIATNKGWTIVEKG